MATKTVADYATDIRSAAEAFESEFEAQAILDLASYIADTRPQDYPQEVVAEIASAYIQGRADGGELKTIVRAMRAARRGAGLSV